MTQRVFVDANVLFSKTLRDWLFLLRIGTQDIFQVHTSEDVLAETLYHWRKHSPRMEGGVITMRLSQMRDVLDEIVEDYPGDAPFDGKDEGDYHVHAAALASRADVLLTANKPGDFCTEATAYEIITPDQFFCDVIRATPATVLHSIIRDQMRYWAGTSHPERAQLNDTLLAAGCPQFADAVQGAMKKIALSKN